MKNQCRDGHSNEGSYNLKEKNKEKKSIDNNTVSLFFHEYVSWEVSSKQCGRIFAQFRKPW